MLFDLLYISELDELTAIEDTSINSVMTREGRAAYLRGRSMAKKQRTSSRWRRPGFWRTTMRPDLSPGEGLTNSNDVREIHRNEAEGSLNSKAPSYSNLDADQSFMDSMALSTSYPYAEPSFMASMPFSMDDPYTDHDYMNPVTFPMDDQYGFHDLMHPMTFPMDRLDTGQDFVVSMDFKGLYGLDQAAKPGQKRSDGSLDGDREFEQSKKLETAVAHQRGACFGQELVDENGKYDSRTLMPCSRSRTDGAKLQSANGACVASYIEATSRVAEVMDRYQNDAAQSPSDKGMTRTLNDSGQCPTSGEYDRLPRLGGPLCQGKWPAPRSLSTFRQLAVALMLPSVHGRPISKHGDLSDAMYDELSDLLHGVISGGIAWVPPGALCIRFLYTIKRMPPDKNLQGYRLMSAVAALGPSLGSDLRASISWWLLLNAVSLVSLIRYAQACAPSFHKSQWLLGALIAGGIGLDCSLCYLSSPSQGVDSNLFGQLLGPSFWLVLVVLDVISKRKAWLRARLQHIVEILV